MIKQAYNFTLEEAYKFMGLQPGASPEEVKNRYRLLAPTLHPDLGGDEEEMKKLNRAKEVIDRGVGDKPVSRSEPTSRTQSDDYESRYEDFMRRSGPQPSKNYSVADIMALAETILERGFIQVLHRERIQYIPMDIGPEYYRPIGRVVSSRKMPSNIDVEKINQALLNFGIDKKRVLNITTRENEAWIIWELKERRGYQCISFERPKEKKKKAPGEGMKRDAFYKYMRENDFEVLAGGSKYKYWGPKGETRKRGMFIREASKTLRLVDRVRDFSQRAIEDQTIGAEVYFGSLTTAILDRWIERVRKSSE